MPGFNGTGPVGMGPMTGGGRGFCAVPSAARWPRTRGRGAWSGGRGWGMGWKRQGYWAAPTAYQMSQKEEVDLLKNEAEAIGEELRQINSRIEQLEESEA